MKIGNKPKHSIEAIKGKRYWYLSIGDRAVSYRYLNDGWRGFEFVIFKPYNREVPEGEAHPYTFRFAFAYWLPFYSI